MAGRKKDGRQLSLEDSGVGGKGVRPSVVLCGSFIYDISSAKEIVHFGTVSIDGQLTRLAEFGQAEKLSQITRKSDRGLTARR